MLLLPRRELLVVAGALIETSGDRDSSLKWPGPLQLDRAPPWGMEVLHHHLGSGTELTEVFNRYPTDKELVSQSKTLCRDYIQSRLQLAGLGWSKAELNLHTSSGKLCEVSAVLLCLGKSLYGFI